ncbi:MAG: threonine/serine dehydratase [Dehalococcoidia bacterium]
MADETGGALGDLEPPTLADVRAAAARIRPYLSLPTPLVHSPALSERLEADVWLKYEFANPIGVFKLRGGLNLALTLPDGERAGGMVTASTGNHGQSIAYAARAAGVPATIFVPVGANPDKISSMRRLGARVVESGANVDEALAAALALAADTGARYVHIATEPALVAGVATAALEVLDAGGQLPDADLAIVPVGAGSGACGWITVRDGLGRPAEIWGVQSAQAPAVHDGWRAGAEVTRPNHTRAEGLATGHAFPFPQSILRGGLADFALVEDDAIDRAVLELIETQHVLVEPAGAAPLAAAHARAERVRGKRVVLVLSGANITRPQLEAILGARAEGEPAT